MAEITKKIKKTKCPKSGKPFPDISFLKNTSGVSPVFGAALLLSIMILAIGFLSVFWVPGAIHEKEAATSQAFRVSVVDLAENINSATSEKSMFRNFVFFRGLPSAIQTGSGTEALNSLFPGLSVKEPAISFSVENGTPGFILVNGAYISEIIENGKKENRKNEDSKDGDKDGDKDKDKNEDKDENEINDRNKNKENKENPNHLKTYRFPVSGNFIKIYSEHSNFPDEIYRIDSFSSLYLFQEDGSASLLPPSVFSTETNEFQVIPEFAEYLKYSEIMKSAGLKNESIPMIIIRTVDFRTDSSIYDNNPEIVLTVISNEKMFFEAESIQIKSGEMKKDTRPEKYSEMEKITATKKSEIEEITGESMEEFTGRLNKKLFHISDDGKNSILIKMKNGDPFVVCLQQSVVEIT